MINFAMVSHHGAFNQKRFDLLRNFKDEITQNQKMTINGNLTHLANAQHDCVGVRVLERSGLFSQFNGGDSKGPNIRFLVVTLLFEDLWRHPAKNRTVFRMIPKKTPDVTKNFIKLTYNQFPKIVLFCRFIFTLPWSANYCIFQLIFNEFAGNTEIGYNFRKFSVVSPTVSQLSDLPQRTNLNFSVRRQK
jgi:hypothetical protein